MDKKTEVEVYDLEVETDLETLNENLGQESSYFKPESDVPYKFSLNNSKVQRVEKEFDGENVTKYVLSVKVRSKDGEVFNGDWEVGASILRPVMKGFSKDIKEFSIIRTGSGQNTRYNVTPVENF